MTQAGGELSPWTPRARAHAWLWTTALLTAAALACAVVLAPPAGWPPVPALTWLLFTGSSVHVASTGWLFTVPAARAYARELVVRCMWAPAGSSGARPSRPVRLVLLVNISLIGGAVLSAASHLHGAGAPGRLLFGGCRGAVMAQLRDRRRVAADAGPARAPVHLRSPPVPRAGRRPRAGLGLGADVSRGPGRSDAAADRSPADIGCAA